MTTAVDKCPAAARLAAVAGGALTHSSYTTSRDTTVPKTDGFFIE
jgi:hypothetical protein